ncbi:matrix Gla protein [Silurus meridionalis]|uniref:matrix Gla protein n=1 Tax=Silurus meridionalis TaxID=175797 RepID=UPI001EEC0DAE|nr:matrix Gla protein [Silurus meridionalis]
MRSLLSCVTLCAVLVIALCYDSEESNESFEDHVKMNPNRANTFISTSGRRNYYRQSYKPVSELRSEICEAYVQCRRLAQRYGSQMAYHSYFANNQGRN